MIVRIEDLKDVCSKISAAMDVSENDTLTSTVELLADGGYLNLIVSNREYYVKAKIDLHEDIRFDATVLASKFLTLISKTTNDTVEFEIKENSLQVTGNGTYQFPLVYDVEGNMLHIPEISVDVVTQKFNISKEIFSSIYSYNARQISNNFSKDGNPYHWLYYIDEEGCITYSNSACVNKFELEKPIKLLLNQKVVKLFKLLTDDTISFSFGHSELPNGTIQSKASFEDSCVLIVATLPANEISSVPAQAIRNRAFSDYKYVTNINSSALLGAIDRILIFTPLYTETDKQIKVKGYLDFTNDSVTITVADNSVSETVYYDNSNPLTLAEDYKAKVDLFDLKAALECCKTEFITLGFGNQQALSISRGNVYNVVPEIH